jgi:hypothetical protein
MKLTNFFAASVDENGIHGVPHYTRSFAGVLSVANYCGGVEEFFAILIFFLGIYFGVRLRLTPTIPLQQSQTARQARRSLLRSPMTICLMIAAVIYRQRPRAIRWPIPASDYHALSAQSTSPLLSPTPPDRDALQTRGTYFRDELNRVALLRGVNLGGGSKLPTAPFSGETFRSPVTLHVDSKEISFVGRPFALSEADEHFGRLAAWGFTFLRLQVTWEAVEHEGPGLYDLAYLKYLRKLVRKADEYGMKVFVDPHQDVWSRYTGGSGAPSWTLDLVGFNVTSLHASGAAFVHQEWVGEGGGEGGDEGGDEHRQLPGQVWGHNYVRLASATMFSLFFSGRDFAPDLLIEGENVQDYLQNKYCDAMAMIARYLVDEKNVVGFDTMNEPSNGYIGFDDLENVGMPVPVMWDMSPFTLMAAAAGFTYKSIPYYSSPMVCVFLFLFHLFIRCHCSSSSYFILLFIA